LGFRDTCSAGASGVSSNCPGSQESAPILLRRLNRFEQGSTEGSEKI
jgi:hypothetical protein